VIKFIQSPYHSSRGNWKISGIVIHTTVGNYQGTINWFQNNSNQVSAHYVVKEDGTEITQMVDEARAAHHAGIVDNPTTNVYRGSNPNFYTVGIEHADFGKPHEHDRSKQYPVTAKLVKEICNRYNLPIDKDHICGHREIRKSKTCPGNLDVDKIILMANNGITHDLNWLRNLILEHINTDIYKTEGEVRPKIQEVIDGWKKYEKLLNDKELLEKEIALAKGESAEAEERLRISERNREELKDELEATRKIVTNRDSEIAQLKAQLEKFEGMVHITEEEYKRITEPKILDRFKNRELFKEILRRILRR